jgi:hypothetical protein
MITSVAGHEGELLDDNTLLVRQFGRLPQPRRSHSAYYPKVRISCCAIAADSSVRDRSGSCDRNKIRKRRVWHWLFHNGHDTGPPCPFRKPDAGIASYQQGRYVGAARRKFGQERKTGKARYILIDDDTCSTVVTLGAKELDTRIRKPRLRVPGFGAGRIKTSRTSSSSSMIATTPLCCPSRPLSGRSFSARERQGLDVATPNQARHKAPPPSSSAPGRALGAGSFRSNPRR